MLFAVICGGAVVDPKIDNDFLWFRAHINRRDGTDNSC